MPMSACPLSDSCWVVMTLLRECDLQRAGFAICRNLEGRYRIVLTFDGAERWTGDWVNTPGAAYRRAIEYIRMRARMGKGLCQR